MLLMWQRISRFVVIVGAIGLSALAGTLALLIFDDRSGHRPVEVAMRAGLANIGVRIGGGGRPVAFQSRGLQLVGDLYGGTGSAPKPAVVIVHGMTEKARTLALYGVLAQELADRGFVVLVFDLPGFGGSENPKVMDNADAWDARTDVLAAVEYLRSCPFVDGNDVHLVGHSMGGSYVLGAAAQSPEIRTVVALGPGRRIWERVNSAGAPDRQYFYQRFLRTRGLDGQLPMATFLEIASLWDSLSYRDAYARASHQPVLLVAGALDDQADLAADRQFYQAISEPKRYVTIPNAGHYNNVGDVFGLAAVYDRAAMDRLINEIDRWLSGRRAGKR